MDNQWPVRLGGIYKNRNSDFSARVTELTEDKVFYFLRTFHLSDGTTSEHNPTDCEINMFRKLYLPEDRSPLPACVEALEACVDALRDLEYVSPSDRTETLEKAKLALALAKG